VSSKRDSVSSGKPNTDKRKYDTQWSIFEEIQDVWRADFISLTTY